MDNKEVVAQVAIDNRDVIQEAYLKPQNVNPNPGYEQQQNYWLKNQEFLNKQHDFNGFKIYIYSQDICNYPFIDIFRLKS